MREILPGILTWAWFSARHGYDFNGWLVRHPEGNVCVDPVEMTDDVLEEITRDGAARIVLTNRNHFRSGMRVRERTGARIAGAARREGLLSVSARTRTAGPPLPPARPGEFRAPRATPPPRSGQRISSGRHPRRPAMSPRRRDTTRPPAPAPSLRVGPAPRSAAARHLRQRGWPALRSSWTAPGPVRQRDRPAPAHG